MASTAVVSELLALSLDFRQANQVEEKLRSLESTEGFPVTLLQVVSDPQVPLDTRLAGALFFKNLVKRKWNDSDGNYLLHASDVQAVKSNIISLMIQVPLQPRKQLGEAVAIIANSDFPDRWPDLIPDIVSKLDIHNAGVNNALLAVAHAIFERWRSLDRSDALFLEIKMVLTQFCEPYFQFTEQCSKTVKSTGDPEWIETMDLLFKLFYDLNCQDLPEFFEDNIQKFMAIMLEYLVYTSDKVEADDDSPSVIENLKSSIFEALTLYTERYEEEFAPFMSQFVESGWTLLTTLGSQGQFDFLVSRCLNFLTAVAKFERNIHMFSSESVLVQIVERIIIPNMRMRESDVENFEDEPLDFVRQDLEGSDNGTRKHAATVFLRELASKMEAEVTKIVMYYVDNFLKEYQSNTGNWLEKNTAVSLFSAIAAKGQITSSGVSTTNLLIDVVQFFNVNMAPELQTSAANPVLKVDAIRFILSFRNQLTKNQLLQAIPMLTSLINKDQQTAVYTYAAITLERILAVRDPVTKRPMFSHTDFAGHVRDMSTHMLKTVAAGSTKPEELASNEFLMRLLMRILIVSGPEVAHVAPLIVPQLVQIIIAVSSNPSNPRFNHYCFESLGACLRHYKNYGDIEQRVVEPMFGILGSNVTEFVPYVLQILTEVLVQLPADISTPASFQQLLRPLLSPQLWEARGNVPAIVGMLRAVVARSPTLVLEQDLLVPLLGVFQNLLSSPSRDQFSFDLLEVIVTNIPVVNLAPYLSQIAKLLLMRLEKAKTQRFGLYLTRFVYSVAACQEPLGPQFIVDFFDSTQPEAGSFGVFSRLFENTFLATTSQIHGTLQRQVATVALTQFLFNVPQFLMPQFANIWVAGMSVLVNLLTHQIAEGDGDAEVEVDVSEMTFGSSFSPLITTRPKQWNPIAYLGEPPQQFFTQRFRSAVGNSQVQSLVSQIQDKEIQEYLIAAST